MSPVQSQEHNPIPEHPPVPDLRAAVERGGAAKYHEATRPRASCSPASGCGCSSTRVRSSRTGSSPTSLAGDLPADGVVTGHRHRRRPTGLPDGQRLDRQGRLVGRAHRREDHPDHRAGLPRPACRWSTWSTRPAPGSPTRSTSSRAAAAPGKIFWNQVRAQRLDPAGVRAVRARRAAGGAYIPAFCDVVVDGRGQRVDVPRLRPDGRDGDRREDDARGDGRGAGALRRVRRRALPGARPSRRRSTSVRSLPVVPAVQLAGHAAVRAGEAARRPASTSRRWCRPASGRRSTCAATSRACSTRARFFEIHALLGARADGRLRPAGRRGRRRGRQQLDVQGRRAVRRLGRQGHPVRAALRRVQRAAACSSPTCPGFMVGSVGGEAGHHPARREDDHARSPRPRCRRSAWWCARRTAPGCTRWPGPGFEPDATLALPTAKIAVMGAEAAVNAVYANKIAAIEDEAERAEFVAAKRARVRRGHRHRPAGQRARGRRRSSTRRRCATSWSAGSRPLPRQGPALLPPPARRHPRLTG